MQINQQENNNNKEKKVHPKKWDNTLIDLNKREI